MVYGTTPAPGKTPKHHMASEMAGFMWPPDALPGGVRISPTRSNATAGPMISSSTLICGITREMSEGPVTHLTMLVTPKSRTKVRISSNALSWDSGATRSASLGAPRDSSIVAPSQHGPCVGILDTHPISCAVVLHDIHDCFIG